MANKYTGFWLKLLEFGDSEEERRQLWNAFCYKHCLKLIAQLLDHKERQKVRNRLQLPDDQQAPRWAELEAQLTDIADEWVHHLSLPVDPSEDLQFMDFSGMEFPENVSFAGRILIGANFRQTIFSKQADFSGTEFLGKAWFGGTKFHTSQLSMAEAGLQAVSFAGSRFHDSALFQGTQFPYKTDFGTVVFRRDANFGGAVFLSCFVRGDRNYSSVSFRLSQFEGTSNFKKTEFGAAVEFDFAVMAGRALFMHAVFGDTARFHNCRFQSTTLFRNATFSNPPDFFETELHQDADFSGIDWRTAEKCYGRLTKRDELVHDISIHADHAVRAWDSLALIMSQREKLEDRAVFYRLKMRAQRQRDGRSLLSYLNWLFEASSDYGWSVGRALVCWGGQFVAMGAVLAGLTLNCSSGPTAGWQHFLLLTRDGLSVSFANSHSFLRLAAGDGWLHSSRIALVDSCEANWLFNYIGLVQAVVGPILLFLVLLTLRNRFRLG